VVSSFPEEEDHYDEKATIEHGSVRSGFYHTLGINDI
jgi:hypothetical protein